MDITLQAGTGQWALSSRRAVLHRSSAGSTSNGCSWWYTGWHITTDLCTTRHHRSLHHQAPQVPAPPGTTRHHRSPHHASPQVPAPRITTGPRTTRHHRSLHRASSQVPAPLGTTRHQTGPHGGDHPQRDGATVSSGGQCGVGGRE